jgi:hypothetical protein
MAEETQPVTRITERRPFEVENSEEVRMCLGLNDRIEITDEAANFIITIQDDGHGRAEISVLEGRIILYT